jgi:diguanylate cyclase (GGDEF)-like protein
MVSRMKKWIGRRIALGRFSHRRDVLRFAAWRALWITLAAVLCNLLVHEVLADFDIPGIVMTSNLLTDCVVTLLVASPLAFIGYYSVGSAILDLSVSRQEYVRLSRTDPLTGLMNRRAFVEAIDVPGLSYVLAIVDIDRFKLINDTHGHGAGDQVLVQLSQMLREHFGAEDAVARLGGEEFGIVLWRKSRDETIALVDEFRARVAQHPFPIRGTEVVVTVSIGVSPSDPRLGYSLLLNSADKALYAAKASGRNRVVHADDVAAVMASNENNRERLAV